MKTFKRFFPIAVATLLSIGSTNGQNIAELNLLPPDPLPDQPVKLEIITDFPYSACTLVQAVVTLEEDTITVDVFYEMGFLTALCHSVDTVDPGLFEAGEYVLICNQFLVDPIDDFDSDTLHFTVDIVDGLPKTSSERTLNLYPVPAEDYLLVRTKMTRNAEITIRDLSGKVISTQKYEDAETRIDLSDFASGMYLLVLRTEAGNRYTGKFIVTRN